MPEPAKRLFASYGRRRGRRLRPSRQGLMEGLLPVLRVVEWWGDGVMECKNSTELSAILFPSLHNPTTPFPLFLEIGFGSGEHLAHQAQLHPEAGIIGCEPYINGIATLLALLTSPSLLVGEGGMGGCSPHVQSSNMLHHPPLPNPPPQGGRELSNIRIYNGDARLLIEKLPDHCLDKVFILYPDPWPKARHHKRRLISKEFLDELARVMKPGAELRLATDHSDYCTWILERLLPHPSFIWTAKTCDDWQKPWADWIPTRYEQKRLAGMPTYLTFICHPERVAEGS